MFQFEKIFESKSYHVCLSQKKTIFRAKNFHFPKVSETNFSSQKMDSSKNKFFESKWLRAEKIFLVQRRPSIQKNRKSLNGYCRVCRNRKGLDSAIFRSWSFYVKMSETPGKSKKIFFLLFAQESGWWRRILSAYTRKRLSPSVLSCTA